jgi:RHS repeat-associated protein
MNYSYANPNWKDQLTEYDGDPITYDAIGNPTKYAGYTYSREAGDHLARISGNEVTTSYKYNEGGYRTEKTVNGVTTNYYLEGSHVTYETTGTDEIYYTYDSKLISMNLNGEEYFYVYNLQGDVVGLLDSNGTEVVSYTYDTWGKMISINGTHASTVGEKNPYLYRGYRYDSETGLYYLNARYYNPEWGRMLNADSIGGFTGELLSHNVYAYVQNNPVMYSDPSGFYRVLEVNAGGNSNSDINSYTHTITSGTAGAVADYLVPSKDNKVYSYGKQITYYDEWTTEKRHSKIVDDGYKINTKNILSNLGKSSFIGATAGVFIDMGVHLGTKGTLKGFNYKSSLIENISLGILGATVGIGLGIVGMPALAAGLIAGVGVGVIYTGVKLTTGFSISRKLGLE